MTTINYDKPIADFIAGLDATGHVTHRSYKKKSVTLHHNGGRLSLAGILEVWKTRPASAHFQSDKNGNLGQYVRVYEYAWAVGNTTGNMETVSIEMANETLSPSWRVAEVTWKSAARLAGWLFANVIDGKPRPSRSNLHYHHYWKSTDCAGPFMDSIYDQVLAETQKWYDYFTGKAPSMSTNLTIATKAVVTALRGEPMNTTDTFYADARQVLAWGRSLSQQPVKPESEQAWVEAIVSDNYASAGSIFRGCITNLQDYFGIQEDSEHVLDLLLRMKEYGYRVISYDGKDL